MQNGILGLCLAIIFTASVSLGLSLPPGEFSEIVVDTSLVVSLCLALGVFIFRWRLALALSFISTVFMGVSWGGHASTRESVGNIRSLIGADPVLVSFQATLVEFFHQPEPPDDDVLDRFQNATEPPRFRALAQLDHIKNNEVLVECSGYVTLFIDGDGSEFHIDDVVKGVGWMRGTNAPENPGEADFRLRAFRNDFGGTLSVAGNPELVSKSGSDWLSWTRLRSVVSQWVDHNLISCISSSASQRVETLVVAMTTGRQLVGYRSLRNIFSASGLSHFLAISGFNLAVLFGAVWGFMEFVRIPWIVRGWFLILTAFLFLFVVNIETSVLRAGIAGILVGLSVACDRGWRADGLLAVAAIFTLVCDPWAAWNPGFQLSYGAVLALRYGSGPVLEFISCSKKLLPWLSNILPSSFIRAVATALSASIAAWLMSTPITQSHFGSISLWAAFASTILAPLAAIVTVLASLSCIVGSLPFMDILIGYPLTFFSTVFLWLAESVVNLPAANIRGGAIPWWWALAELCALGACWLCTRTVFRWVGGLLFASLFLVATQFPLSTIEPSVKDWKLRLTTISVGDGSAHIIETHNSCVLFDAGTISRHAGGSQLIVPALKAIGCTHFDAVFISHPHLDHFSGLPEIANAFPIDRVYATEAFVNLSTSQYAPGVLCENLQTHGLTVTPLVAGNSLVFDGFNWSALHPKTGYKSRIVNDGSLTLRIEPVEQFHNTKNPASRLAWLTLFGDVQTEAIAHILASPECGPSMVMELPHHGAWSDGVGELVKRMNSSVLIQSTGFQRFHFDRIGPVVLNKIRAVTCRDGALRVTWFENQITNQILLEQWRGDGWSEVSRCTIVK